MFSFRDIVRIKSWTIHKPFLEGPSTKRDVVSKQQRIVCFLIILISVWLLVFLTTAISRAKQQEEEEEDPFSTQQLLPYQTAILSQQSEASNNITPAPILKDSDLEVELVTEGLKSPTSMAFIGNQGDMLISEKSGEVILFLSENKSKITLLNFTVNDQTERGLLGVAVINNNMSALHTTAILALSNNETITTRENSTNDSTSTTTTTTSSSSSSTPTSTFVFFYLTEASKE